MHIVDCNIDIFRPREDAQQSHHRPTESSSVSAGETPWIGVDFDGTLATYLGWFLQGEALGDPVPAMAERVRRWVREGKYQVKIMTARAARPAPNRYRDIALIQRWCEDPLGIILDVTAEKDFAMVALYDDRAVAVEMNTGRTFGYGESADLDPLAGWEQLKLIPRYESGGLQ